MSDTPTRETARQIAERIAGSHYVCEDCWYSCPLSSEGCCDESQTGCNCGRDARVDRIVEAIEAHTASLTAALAQAQQERTYAQESDAESQVMLSQCNDDLFAAEQARDEALKVLTEGMTAANQLVVDLRTALWDILDGVRGEDRTLVGMVKLVGLKLEEARDNRRGEFELRIAAEQARDEVLACNQRQKDTLEFYHREDLVRLDPAYYRELTQALFAEDDDDIVEAAKHVGESAARTALLEAADKMKSVAYCNGVYSAAHVAQLLTDWADSATGGART